MVIFAYETFRLHPTQPFEAYYGTFRLPDSSLTVWIRLFTKYKAQFLANVNSRSRSLYAIVRPSDCLSVVCLSVTFVQTTQVIKMFGNVLRHLVRRTSIDFEVKFYGDRPRGTPPSGG